jgi:hypothetical protein
MGDITLWLFPEKGNRVYTTRFGADIKGIYVDAMHTLVRFSLPADTAYTIVPRQKEPSLGDHNFTLSAFSDHKILLSPATPLFSHSITLEEEWDWNNAKGNVDEAEFGSNPQYKFVMSQKGHVSISLECWNPDIKVNLLLYKMGGARVFTVKDKGIELGTKEYEPGFTLIQTESFEPLYAGTYTLVASTYEPKQESKYTLQIDSTADVTVTSLRDEFSDPEAWTMVFPKAIFPSQVTALGIPIKPTVIDLELRVIVKFDSSFYPNQDIDHGYSPNGRRSELRITIQTGTGPNTQILARSNINGRFEDAGPQGQRLIGAIVRCKQAVNNDMYLVLERLVGFPTEGSEERFNVWVIHKGGSAKDRLWVGEQWHAMKEYGTP